MEEGQEYELTRLLSGLDVSSPSHLHYLLQPLSCPFAENPINCPFLGFCSDDILAHCLDAHRLQIERATQVTFFLNKYLVSVGLSGEVLKKYFSVQGENKLVVSSLLSAEDDVKIRKELSQTLLNDILTIQAIERESFHKLPFQCLFCKEPFPSL